MTASLDGFAELVPTALSIDASLQESDLDLREMTIAILE
jgi:hypothetical protein